MSNSVGCAVGRVGSASASPGQSTLDAGEREGEDAKEAVAGKPSISTKESYAGGEEAGGGGAAGVDAAGVVLRNGDAIAVGRGNASERKAPVALLLLQDSAPVSRVTDASFPGNAVRLGAGKS